MSLWTAIKHSVNSQISKPLDTQLTEQTTTLTGGAVPIIRHIQTGTMAFTHTSVTQTADLTGFTNLDKMIVLLDGGRISSVNNNQARLPYIQSLTVSQLTVEAYNDSSIDVSYQVIEFW